MPHFTLFFLQNGNIYYNISFTGVNQYLPLDHRMHIFQLSFGIFLHLFVDKQSHVVRADALYITELNTRQNYC